MKEKISFLCFCDYANVLTEYSKIINDYSDKFESRVISLVPHPFKYSLKHDFDLFFESVIPSAKKWVEDSKYVIFSEEIGHGTYETLNRVTTKLNIKLTDKKLSVWHPGTHYRTNYRAFNSNPFNVNLDKIIYAIDLYRLSPKTKKDNVLLPFKNFNIDRDVYLEKMVDKINKNNRLFLHCPSSPEKKGSNAIQQTLNSLKGKNFNYSMFANQPHDFIMQKKEESLFYIDQFNIESSFGVSSVESLICGNVTMCGINNSVDGILRYGSNTNCPIINLGISIDSLKNKLTEVMDYDKNKLIEISENNINYLLECYHGNSVIKYLETKIFCDE